MKVLVTGAAGQLGNALCAHAPSGAQVIGLNSSDLDVTDRALVADTVQQHSPEVIVNAAAYTAVDRAETDEQRALEVNGTAVANLAAAARDVSARLVQVSTDFVFAGDQGTPYRPGDTPSPVGAYGRTKLAGELAASANDDALIVRTSWVYAASGANFVLTMLRLMRERDQIRVVADQIGTPTWATSLAGGLWMLIAENAAGILHYSDSGACSWYDLAVAIGEEALSLGLLSRPVEVVPIATSDYPTPAHRPSFSVLDKRETWEIVGTPAPHWRANLREMLKELSRYG